MVTDGSHFSPTTTASGYPYITVRDIKDGQIDFENCAFVSEDSFQALRRNGCSPSVGDILFSKDGTVGKVALVRSPRAFVVLSSLAILRPNTSLVDAAYLAYVLKSPAFLDAAIGQKTGVAIRRIILKNLKQISVPLPSLSEQRRIVAILDEAFQGIATAQANAETSLQAALNLVAVGYEAIARRYDRSRWPTKTVAAIAADCKGAMRTGPFGSQLLHSEFVDDGVAVLGIDNAVANEFRWDKRRYITPQKYLQLSRYRVRPGDVLITIMGTCGRCAVVPDDIPLAINTKHLCCITLDRTRCMPEFLHGYFLYDSLAREYLESQAKGSIMAGLNMGIISELPVQLPALHEQAEIVELVASLRTDCTRLAAIQREKLTALAELTKSLLHQAFTGQLTSSKQARAGQQTRLQTTTPEFAANVIALAHARHERQHREKTFGRVKEQKTLHLVEAIGKIDLGRQPMRDAAGPNDFQHMLKAEEWARSHNFFEMVKREGGYDFKKLIAFDEHLARAREALEPYLPQLERVIDLLVPMDKEDAEVFATVHAAWNNLVIDDGDVTESAIVSAAREDWHADKVGISKQKFRTAIALIRQHGLVPDGTAKYVGGQQSLL
jgi:type I restriction enzyme, S subunit